jgi:hypothetical protein
VTRRKIFSRPQKKNFIFSLVQKQTTSNTTKPNRAKTASFFLRISCFLFPVTWRSQKFFFREAERERKREISNTTFRRHTHASTNGLQNKKKKQIVADDVNAKQHVLLGASSDFLFRPDRRLGLEDAQDARSFVSVDLWAVGDWYAFGGDRGRRVQALGANFIFLLLSEIFSLSFRGEFSIIDRSFARVVSAIARAISKERRKRRKTNREVVERKESVVGFFASLSLSLSLSLFYFFKIQFFFCSIQFCLFSFPRFFLTDSLFASLLFLKFVKIRAAAG